MNLNLAPAFAARFVLGGDLVNPLRSRKTFPIGTPAKQAPPERPPMQDGTHTHTQSEEPPRKTSRGPRAAGGERSNYPGTSSGVLLLVGLGCFVARSSASLLRCTRPENKKRNPNTYVCDCTFSVGLWPAAHERATSIVNMLGPVVTGTHCRPAMRRTLRARACVRGGSLVLVHDGGDHTRGVALCEARRPPVTGAC